MEGLHRLIRSDYQFTLSDRAKTNMKNAVADGSNLVDFMKSHGYFQFKADAGVSSKDLYETYELWCKDNALHPLAQKTITSFLKQNE